jgi:hypothetical protein
METLMFTKSHIKMIPSLNQSNTAKKALQYTEEDPLFLNLQCLKA